ncbi:DNA endonuclease SmrA [Pseudoalteromonas ruthenica]|uniref:DNA endonuclease SmrA n=1 Tax=Pseudoalteromonas ruthenica TaxID=151081 RepID=UPI0003B2E6A3|nr:DNA endonuclease SmrA [Pseudoalteromonas ruthenica]
MTASHKSPDSDLFAELMEDVTPLKQNDKVSYFEPHTTPTLAQQHKRLAAQLDAELDDNILSTEYIDLIDPLDFIAYKKDGVQDGVYKNLRLGKYGVDATLDLHGQSLLQARQALYETVSDCHQRNIRVLLVRHGTGERNRSQKGLLKSYVNHWLKQLSCVLACHSALKPHGGLGATYVLLKKSADKKLENRERHAKR